MYQLDQVGSVPDHDDLGGPSGQELSGEQRGGEGGGVVEQEVAQQVDDLCGPGPVPVRVGQGAQAGQRERGDGVGRWNGSVEDVLGPDDERLGVPAGGEEAAAVIVMEQLEESIGGVGGPLCPDGFAGELAQAGEAVDEPGVVGRVGQVPGATG